MKVLHLSTSDIDNGGARAAYRLHQGLQALQCDSQMLVRAKFSSDDSVTAERSLITKLGPPASSLPLRFYPQRNATMFSPQWFPDVITARARQIDPDIVHLHWVCNGFLQIESLPRFAKPLVWTLHDMWPFTGGCDYVRDCTHYQKSCGSCPQLGSNRSRDLSRQVWQRKVKAWKNINLVIVATSRWMADCACSSSLFQDRRIEVIPLGLDTEKYKPINQRIARELLNLPQEKPLVLFGAINATSDQRKGFHLLSDALKCLGQTGWADQLEVIVFGSSKPATSVDLGFKAHYLGRLHDDLSLALAYSASDVMVTPSIQEAFGQTASEALSCGTPVVAFNTTGLQDIVDHQLNGFLATPFEVEDLAKGIVWVLEDSDRHQKLRFQARQKSLREFASQTQAQRYLSLYQEILEL
ncbi:glycosyltransferase family 4 protein [Leptothermofonsia sichuanensis E412]|uniref:glycosyltransferase family 4 protein n=1 Tax=Leptothermofonsia sichuanensis TaxID=2917832 RepID=UPI001CA7328B|nr:glycosyltransferase family 4 protein [Leptothermofonsia sichuanensis]QZZ22102.1 glycosyltransferase family 4 protein [Leptothermofonsia sichuanensis E412]